MVAARSQIVKAHVLSALLQSQKNKGMLSPAELVALADRMVATKDPEEADRIEQEIIAGFYGANDAQNTA